MKAIINGTNVSINKLKYQHNNRLALSAETEEETYAILTVNLPDALIQPNEAAIDVNNLGMDIIPQLVAQAIIEAPEKDKWVQSGFVNYPICKILI